MRILLVGEYSRFHNSLKEGLLELGHEVLIIGDNDFKNYPLDISVFAKAFKKNYLLNKIRQGIFRLFNLDLAQIETAYRFYIHRKKLVGFDIVQLINEYPLQSTIFLEKKMLGYIFKNNKKIFLSSCGDDFVSVKYMLESHFRYSVLTPCETNPDLGHCPYTLRYATIPFQELHDFVYQNIAAVIPGDLDYAIPLVNHPKAKALIPYPINVDNLAYKPLKIEGKIIIFHGINEANYLKKGNAFFEAALQTIEKKYPQRVEIVTVKSVPYATYIELYNKSHIVLDQTFSYDQGYNALEAMARGKVVFTGAEIEFMEHFSLGEKVCINALADVEYLIKELSFLIENPNEILALGLRARQFVEKEHNYKSIAARYLGTWEEI